jgi:TRAP-type mannitol/chloroaromatic compound transport system permease small subunit
VAFGEGAPGAVRPSAFGMVLDGLNGLGSLLLFGIMLLVCADVISRNLLNAPIYGVAEVVSVSIVAIVFLQLASALRHNRLSRAELFIDVFRLRHPMAGGLLQALFDVAGAAVCLLLLYASWPIFAQAWRGDEFIGVVGQFTMATWPVKLIVVVGSALTAVQFVINCIADVRAAMRGQAAP